MRMLILKNVCNNILTQKCMQYDKCSSYTMHQICDANNKIILINLINQDIYMQ